MNPQLQIQSPLYKSENITTPKIANTPSFQSPNPSKSNEVLSPSNQVSLILILSEPQYSFIPIYCLR